MKEACSRFSLLRRFDMRADIRSRKEHLLAQDELLLHFVQILVEPHDSEREFVGFFEHDVFTLFIHGCPPDSLGRPFRFFTLKGSPPPRRPSTEARRDKARSIGWDIARDCAGLRSLLSRP